jgi:hypothetical protein
MSAPSGGKAAGQRAHEKRGGHTVLRSRRQCGSGRGMLQSAGLESEEWGGGRGGSARLHRRGSGANRVGERRQAGAVEKLWGQEGVWVVGKQLVGQVE